MPEEVFTIVRVPVKEVEESLRAKHTLPRLLNEVRIDGDNLVFYFSGELESLVTSEIGSQSIGKQRRRRACRKRNRMKTRGWDVVGRMTNSKGQQCTIYKPFVDALRTPGLTLEEQKMAVEKILRANRNRPSETSVRYFLENTREFIEENQDSQKDDTKSTKVEK
jgi:hypothetical protein